MARGKNPKILFLRGLNIVVMLPVSEYRFFEDDCRQGKTITRGNQRYPIPYHKAHKTDTIYNNYAYLRVSFQTINRWEKGRATPSPMAMTLIELQLRQMRERGADLMSGLFFRVGAFFECDRLDSVFKKIHIVHFLKSSIPECQSPKKPNPPPSKTETEPISVLSKPCGLLPIKCAATWMRLNTSTSPWG